MTGLLGLSWMSPAAVSASDSSKSESHLLARCQNRSRIQSDTSSIASGANVSSICPYSDTAPVVAVWNRWLSPSSSVTVASELPPSAASSAGMLSSADTCRSRSPISASEPSHRVEHGNHAVSRVVAPSLQHQRLVPVQHRDRVRCFVRIETNKHLGHCRLLVVAVLTLDGTGSASSSRTDLSSATLHPRSRPPAIQEPQPEPGPGSRFTSEPSRTPTRRLVPATESRPVPTSGRFRAFEVARDRSVR